MRTSLIYIFDFMKVLFNAKNKHFLIFLIKYVQLTVIIMNVISNRNCRICLSQCETRDLDVAQFSSKYFICTGFKIDKNDIPQKICSTCSIELINSSNFRAKCEETESLLKLLLPAQEGDNNEFLNFNLDTVKSNMNEEEAIVSGEDDAKSVIRLNYCSDDYDKPLQLNCDFCEYSVNSCKRIPFLRTHVSKCHKDLITEFHCSKCSMTFPLQSLLNFHIKEFHSPNDIKNHFTCTFCGLHSLRSETVQNHVLVHHKNATTFTCIICQKTFRTMDHLRLHIKQTFCNNNILADSEIDFEYRIRCDFCEFFCALEANMKHHFEKMHQNEQPLMCSCGSISIYCKDLAKEYLKYKCNQERPCTSKHERKPVRFKRKAKILKEIDGLTSEERKRMRQNEIVKCEICQETMKRASLQRHITNIHCGVKYFCPHCEKSFTLQQTLKIHIEKKHLNYQTEYPCKYCDKKFYAWASRYYHEIRIHTKNFKFKCKQCNKHFIRQSEYDDHQSMHTGAKNRQCSECNEKFSTRDILRTHKETVHRVDPFPQCIYCEKVFAHGKLLRKHLSQFHGKKHESKTNNDEVEEKSNNYHEVEKYLVEYIEKEEMS